MHVHTQESCTYILGSGQVDMGVNGMLGHAARLSGRAAMLHVSLHAQS